MRELLEAGGRGFARVATRAVVARPALWRVFRGPLRALFDRLAPVWDANRSSGWADPLEAALDRLERPPSAILDLGTGTGKAARLLALRYPDAEVAAVDISPAMVAEAERLLPEELSGRVRFQVADAAALPYEEGAFDLVVLLNMIPFFAELARVLAPGGTLVAAFSLGPETPIYVPAETLRGRLEALGFAGFEDVARGAGTAVLARRSEPGYDAGQATSAAR